MTAVSIQFNVDPYMAQQITTLYQVLSGQFPKKPRNSEFDVLLDTLAILHAQVMAMAAKDERSNDDLPSLMPADGGDPAFLKRILRAVNELDDGSPDDRWMGQGAIGPAASNGSDLFTVN